MTELDVRDRCGLEATLYLQFHLQCARFFGLSNFTIHFNSLVSVFSIFVLLPTYYFTKEDTGEKEFTLQELTMRPDDQKNEFVVWIVFFFTVVYSMLGHLLIYFFEDKMRVLP